MPDHRVGRTPVVVLHPSEQVITTPGESPLPGRLGRGHHAEQQQRVLAMLRPAEDLRGGQPATPGRHRVDQPGRQPVVADAHAFSRLPSPRLSSRSAMSAVTVSRM